MKNIFLNPTLITNPKNITYITGANFEGFWILSYNSKLLVVTSKMIAGQAKNFFKSSAKIFVAQNSFSDCVIEICKKYKINKIYIDTTDINYILFKTLKNKFNNSNILALEDEISVPKKRIIKDKEEIKNIQKACTIVSQVLEKVKKQVVAGMSELDIHFKIEEEFAKNHVVQSFKTIVASGPNAANPHHVSGKRKIKKNDLVLIDMGCIYNGYCSDLTRTFFVGKPTKEQTKVWNIVKLAHDKAISAVKENMKASDIDLVARNIIKDNGFEKNFIHTTGHGVGLDIHEAPSVSTFSKSILKEGMIITVEPGIYLQNKFGVRIEDTLLVTKNGYKILTY